MKSVSSFACQSEIVDETSDQAFGRLTTTLLSVGTVGFLYGMGDTGGECCSCLVLSLSCPFTATGGS